MKSGRRLRRTLAGVLAAGALLTGAAGVIGAGIALSAAPANATPEEDCAAVRARDHQIYLNLIASLPPGAPIPPEIINPCLSAPSTTSTAAPTTTVGLPGVQAPGGGPNVGANAPTNFPTYNGTPIVPVPTIEVPPIASESPASETGVGAFPNASASAVPSPTPTPGEGTTTDRGPGPIPADSDSNIAPAQTVPDPAADVSTAGEDSGRDRYLELVLVGAAAFTAAGMRVRGRPGPFSARVSARPWESVLSQVVGTVAKPFMPYFVGGQDVVVIPDPGGGQRTIFLIHDETSSHEAEMVVDLPPGGHMSINDDGSVGVYDANGDLQGTVAAAWAYDVNGDPVPTYYEIRDGKLYQVVIPTPGVIYPVTADGPYGGSDPVTGRDVTATPLQGGGEVVNQSGGPVMVNVPTDSPYNDVGGIDPLGNLDMDPPTQPAPTTPLPFDIGSPTDSGTDTSEPPWNPLDNLDMDAPTQPAPTTPLPFDIGSPTDSGTDTPGGTASEPPWNPLDNLDMETQTQPDPPMELPFGIFDSDPNNGLIGPAQRAANQRALAHGDVPADFTGNVPLTAQQQLDDLQWQVDQMRDRGYTDSEIATVLSKGSTALGGPASGLQSAGALANTGVHHAGSLPSAAQAARSAAVGTVLSRLSVAVEVASGVIKWREGAPRGETVGNSGGAIALGWAGGKGGAALGGFLGGPIGAAVGGGIGAIGGSLLGAYLGTRAGRSFD